MVRFTRPDPFVLMLVSLQAVVGLAVYICFAIGRSGGWASNRMDSRGRSCERLGACFSHHGNLDWPAAILRTEALEDSTVCHSKRCYDFSCDHRSYGRQLVCQAAVGLPVPGCGGDGEIGLCLALGQRCHLRCRRGFRERRMSGSDATCCSPRARLDAGSHHHAHGCQSDGPVVSAYSRTHYSAGLVDLAMRFDDIKPYKIRIDAVLTVHGVPVSLTRIIECRRPNSLREASQADNRRFGADYRFRA